MGIGHTNSNHVQAELRPFCGAEPAANSATPMSHARGVADLARHPLIDPIPSGGDGCQGWSSDRDRTGDRAYPVPEICRDGHKARPAWFVPPAGATDASGTPQTRLGFADWQSDESGVLTRFHPQ
jgi:hypothetical protein